MKGMKDRLQQLIQKAKNTLRQKCITNGKQRIGKSGIRKIFDFVVLNFHMRKSRILWTVT